MNVYEATFDQDADTGVYALSVVKNPAMEDMWLALSEQEKVINLEAVDSEKRLLLGAALIPDKKIYRNIDGEEFYITFTKETIEKLAHGFLKNGNQNNSTENHDVKLNGMSVVEAWVVEDPERDKSAVYGKKYEKGTWVCMMKVDDENIWKKAKSGELNGFSIDALLKTRKINFKKDIIMSKTEATFLEKMEAKFNVFLEKVTPKTPVKLAQVTLKDGKTKFEFEGENPEVGTAVFVLSQEGGEKFRAPKGEHELEDGSKMNVDENGLIAEAAEADPIEEPNKELEAKMEKMVEAQLAKQETAIQLIKDEHKVVLDKKEARIVELELKLKETPAAPKLAKTEKERENHIKMSIEGKTAKERLHNKIQLAKESA